MHFTESWGGKESGGKVFGGKCGRGSAKAWAFFPEAKDLGTRKRSGDERVEKKKKPGFVWGGHLFAICRGKGGQDGEERRTTKKKAAKKTSWDNVTG